MLLNKLELNCETNPFNKFYKFHLMHYLGKNLFVSPKENDFGKSSWKIGVECYLVG